MLNVERCSIIFFAVARHEQFLWSIEAGVGDNLTSLKVEKNSFYSIAEKTSV